MIIKICQWITGTVTAMAMTLLITMMANITIVGSMTVIALDTGVDASVTMVHGKMMKIC